MEIMTCTVIGNAIVDQPTREERAAKARSMKDTLNIDDIISQFLVRANTALKTDDSAVTWCMVYNATGDPVKFVKEHDYNGFARSYPPEIKNGQTGIFMHSNASSEAAIESSGAVVYRAKNKNGKNYDWMFAWRHVKGSGTKQVYTEVKEAGHFDKDNVWTPIYEKLCNSGQSSRHVVERCESIASIGGKTAAVHDGLMNII